MGTTWSDCVKLHDDLRNNKPGITDRIKNLEKVDFSDFIRSYKSCDLDNHKDQIQGVKSVLNICGHLKKVDLRNRCPTPGHLETLRDVFENVKIDELNLQRGTINQKGMVHLAKLIEHCEVKRLVLHWSQQGFKNLKKFVENGENIKLDELDASLSNIGRDGMIHLAKLVELCQVKKLDVRSCRLTSEHLKNFVENARNIKLDELIVNGNNIGPDGMIHLAKLLEHCQVKSLDVGGCKLKSEHLKNFIENAGNIKLDELDVGYNNICPDGMIHLAKFVEHCQVKRLKVSNCTLESEHLKNFVENAGNVKLDELMVNDNNIGPDGMTHLAKFVEHCQVKILKVNSCKLESEHLKNFVENAGNVKLNEFSISWNRDIGPEGWLELGKFARASSLSKLDAHYCEPTTERLEKLIQGMDGAKLDHLNLDDFSRMENMSSIQKLFPLVNKKLMLPFASDSELKELQEKLNQVPPSMLKVVSGITVLKASPMDLPPTLPRVEKVQVKEDGDSMLVTWDPLSNSNVSYFVEILTDGSEVVERFYTAGSIQLKFQARTNYEFFIWGYTNNAISCYTSWKEHKTGDLPINETENAEMEADATNMDINTRKRTNIVQNEEGGYSSEAKHSKKNVEGWLQSSLPDSAADFIPPADIRTHAHTRVSSPISQDQFNGSRSTFPNAGNLNLMFNMPENLASASDIEPQQRFGSMPAVTTDMKMNADMAGRDRAAYDTGRMRESAMRNGSQDDYPDDIIPLNTPGPPRFASPEMNLPNVSLQHPHQGTENDSMVWNALPYPNFQGAYDPSSRLEEASQSIHDGPLSVANIQHSAPTMIGAQKVTSVDENERFVHQQSSDLHILRNVVLSNNNTDNDPAVHDHTTDPIPRNSSINCMENIPQPGSYRNELTVGSRNTGNSADGMYSIPPESAHASVPRAVYPPVDNMNPRYQYREASTSRLASTFSNTGRVIPPLVMSRSQMGAPDQTENYQNAEALRSLVQNSPTIPHPSATTPRGQHETSTDLMERYINQRLEEMRDEMSSKLIENKEEQDEKIGEQAKKIREQDEKIAKLTEENETQKEKISNLEQRVEELLEPVAPGDPDQIKDFNLPMKDVAHVTQNEALLNDRENAKHLVSYLATIGGSEHKKIIWGIMRKLFTNELALEYSWEGRKGKMAFCNLKIAEVIKESAKKRDVTEATAVKQMMLWLRGAGDRGGGRRKRDKAQVADAENVINSGTQTSTE